MVDDAPADSRRGKIDAPPSAESRVPVNCRSPLTPALTAGVVTLATAAALSTHYWLQIEFLTRLYARYQIPWEMPRSPGFPSYGPLSVICTLVAATVTNALTTYVAIQKKIDPSKLWCLIQAGTAMGLAAPVILRGVRIGIFHGYHESGLLQRPSVATFWIPFAVGTTLGVLGRAFLDRHSASKPPLIIDGLLGIAFWLSCFCVLHFVIRSHLP